MPKRICGSVLVATSPSTNRRTSQFHIMNGGPCDSFCICTVRRDNMFFVAFIICTILSVHGQGVHKRFEYKYGFKPPYLAQKDGTVPFWEHKGSKCVAVLGDCAIAGGLLIVFGLDMFVSDLNA